MTAELFPAGYRGSGVLLHPTSLPSPYGIGDLGPEAAAWIGRLADAGQGWWQMLPLGPPGRGNSPYEPFSTFAGNEMLISPQRLIEDGLLDASDCAGPLFPDDFVDYLAVSAFKQQLIERAESRFRNSQNSGLKSAFDEFCAAQAGWLDDYALFRALKIQYGGVEYHEWPAELVRREPSALARARQAAAVLVDRFRFAQFLVFRQTERLKSYAHARGVRLIGDVPFFVSPDSADVWANPELFLLDGDFKPKFFAGVPPDYFSPDGQLWGDPLYNWDALRQSGYRWWVERLRTVMAFADIVRLDHFRAFAAAWHIPAGATTAKTGHWEPGPGADFLSTAQSALGLLPFIAEDLGLITDDVIALRKQFLLPGMRVLHFAFDGDPANPFLPENYVHDAVAYTGTHDNNTSLGWYQALKPEERQILWNYLNRESGDAHEVPTELMRLAWESKAALAVAPLQDVLGMGAEARMNVPGYPLGNWRWRCAPDKLSAAPFETLRALTERTGRLAQ